MNDADVPDTDEVRAAFVMQTTRFRITYGELFDRWLAEHDRAVAEKVIAEIDKMRPSNEVSDWTQYAHDRNGWCDEIERRVLRISPVSVSTSTGENNGES